MALIGRLFARLGLLHCKTVVNLDFHEIADTLHRMDFRLWKLTRETASLKEKIMTLSPEVQDLSDQIVALKASNVESAQKVTDAFARLEQAVLSGKGLSDEDKAAIADAKQSVQDMTGSEQAQSAQADAEAPPAS